MADSALAEEMRVLRNVCEEDRVFLRISHNLDAGKDAVIEMSDERHGFDAEMQTTTFTAPTMVITITAHDPVLAVTTATAIAQTIWG